MLRIKCFNTSKKKLQGFSPGFSREYLGTWNFTLYQGLYDYMPEKTEYQDPYPRVEPIPRPFSSFSSDELSQMTEITPFPHSNSVEILYNWKIAELASLERKVYICSLNHRLLPFIGFLMDNPLINHLNNSKGQLIYALQVHGDDFIKEILKKNEI